MIFLYHPSAGKKNIILDGAQHHYIFSVRRTPTNVQIHLRNLSENVDYVYSIETLNKRQSQLFLQSVQPLLPSPKGIHLAWGRCDAKTVYKTLPMLNELGVDKITFLQCSRSQGNISYNFDKIRSILISSCEQCGRNDFIDFNETSLPEFLEMYPRSIICDFSGERSSYSLLENPVVVGPEGGFTNTERELFGSHHIISFAGHVLRSETACIKVSSL